MEVFDSGFTPISSLQKLASSTHSNLKVFSQITATLEELKAKYISSKRTWIVAFSGGKDSTCILQLVYEMLCSLPPYLRRQTYAIASNTLVEAPHIDKFLHSVIDSINTHAKENSIPFEVLQVSPKLKDDFWVNLIGKGYPSPTRTFRWCTDRLKITPAKSEVARITHQYGSALLILGTRKAESSNRKKSIEKRILNEEGYSQHHDFPNTLTYSPLAEWSTDEVWSYLATHKPLWQKDHSELFALYAKASGEECQFITDLSQNSCGGSRFGCWVCTVVNEDKSMQGFIASGEYYLKPLNEFRNYIKDLREDSKARADYKRDGRAVYRVGGLGPFLSHIRINILKKLLQTEREFIQNGGSRLISDSQILAIQEQWNKDFDFEFKAIKLAKEVGRMKEIELEESKVLHSELLEEVASKEVDSKTLENLINTCIDIYNTAGLRGRNNASTQIKKEIEKLLEDRTSKVKEKM
ncbi:DNA phosphorothioation system sulfurtransferase DndC [Helicobacter sp. MIT 14-3879]|uniref:DNA phosphorothioation system sulfurtransferase DndC n=1 Tax=Helicobacter sp. MIT 14-3879 TaxID=2040649 RepID=UPI000E1EBB6A|nr:DNA phosphorothioation system sulfurtransferase DndC [Helicobacter sp. MIT 14-3879]RDU60089.1 DNA phosphorothioation system sulfurtransferase DndC [Helicobacter sp. MIT 14-3879]